MKTTKELLAVIEKETGMSAKKIKVLGKGATAKVYLIKTNLPPFYVAVKVSSHVDNLAKEMNMLSFLNKKGKLKVPEVIFFFQSEGLAFLGMTYIKGISGASPLVAFVPDKKHLKESIIGVLDNIQSIKNNKFGKYTSAQYDSWKEYYFDFFESIYTFAKLKYQNGEINQIVILALEKIKLHFDEIFIETQECACLCHGDFWMPNFIINFKKSELVAVLDPFDILWAEPEYELFALTVGYGKKMGLYEEYKKHHKVSEQCDLKVEIYALVNELHWYSVLGSIGIDYIEYRAKNVLKILCK